MAKVFLSYNRQSEQIAAILAKDIEDLGHNVWFDNELSGGQVWWNQILGQIRECALFVFVLSPEGLESEACKSEYTYAFDLGKPVLPILVSQEVSVNLLPELLSKIEYVNYITRDTGAALRLARAFGGITLAGPLPDPLPKEPDTPVSYLGSLKEKVESKVELTSPEQRGLLVDLTTAVRDAENTTDGLKLLEKLRRRRDLLAIIRDEIDDVLANERQRLAPRQDDKPPPFLPRELQVGTTALNLDLNLPDKTDPLPRIRPSLNLQNRTKGAAVLTGAGVIAGLAMVLLWFLRFSHIEALPKKDLFVQILLFCFGGAIAGAISGLDSRRIIAALVGMGLGLGLNAWGQWQNRYGFASDSLMFLGALAPVLGVLSGVTAEVAQTMFKRQRQRLQPGAIDITVTNGMGTEDGFTVILDGLEIKTIRGTGYQIFPVSAGRHLIEVTGVVNDVKTNASQLVQVGPDEIVKVTLTLPVRERVFEEGADAPASGDTDEGSTPPD